MLFNALDFFVPLMLFNEPDCFLAESSGAVIPQTLSCWSSSSSLSSPCLLPSCLLHSQYDPAMICTLTQVAIHCSLH